MITGRPSAEQLESAVEQVLEKIRADQIILFGSAARGEMHEGATSFSWSSAKAPRETTGGGTPRWGDTPVNAILRDRRSAERERASAVLATAAALAEGRNLYRRDGARALPLGPRRNRHGEPALYEPDLAPQLLERAERRWKFTIRYPTLTISSDEGHEVIGWSLRALVTAQGRRVRNRRNLNALWHEVQDQIPVRRLEYELRQVSRWTDEFAREGEVAELWRATARMAGGLLRHAAQRVPELMARTWKQIHDEGPLVLDGRRNERLIGGRGDGLLKNLLQR